MPKQRPSLAGLVDVARGTDTGATPPPSQSKPLAEESMKAVAKPAPPKKQKDRVEKKTTTFYPSKTAHKELKKLAADLDRTMDSLLIEALNELFIKYDRNPIA